MWLKKGWKGVVEGVEYGCGGCWWVWLNEGIVVVGGGCVFWMEV